MLSELSRRRCDIAHSSLNVLLVRLVAAFGRMQGLGFSSGQGMDLLQATPEAHAAALRHLLLLLPTPAEMPASRAIQRGGSSGTAVAAEAMGEAAAAAAAMAGGEGAQGGDQLAEGDHLPSMVESLQGACVALASFFLDCRPPYIAILELEGAFPQLFPPAPAVVQRLAISVCIHACRLTLDSSPLPVEGVRGDASLEQQMADLHEACGYTAAAGEALLACLKNAGVVDSYGRQVGIGVLL